MSKVKLLILCTQNSARSQIAEAFFNKYGQDVLEVYSAGLEPTAVNPYAVQVMQESGVDISGQRSKSVKEFLGKQAFGYVVAVCKQAESRCPVIFPGVPVVLSWPFDDPADTAGTEADKLPVFRRVRDEIEAKVKAWVADYRQQQA
ncbi:arsenate reductase ArsC [Sporomusa sphaeroides]|uniref:arsenate reductase ArsC n=1 Tax=Sporomusa sphaeroides TaxID=47679 RepID=UPI002C411932|nr:arsenate reductase ArsC [Sporomusa sphaeroides]HML35202.1 arsenate reductase ArsC [Sporomusa sphaeroides]